MASPGFSSKVQFTPVPNSFFGSILEDIDDLAELKLTMRVIWLVAQKKTLPRLVSLGELLSDQTLVRSVFIKSQDVNFTIKMALDKAIERGTLVQAKSNDKKQELVYFINTEEECQAFNRSKSQYYEIQTVLKPNPWVNQEIRPNIFSLYETNIGILTPLLAEELKDAEATYPNQWIEEAFKEAVISNKRSWRYISRILERWNQEGRNYGEHGEPWGHIKKADPKKYLRL